MNDRLTRIIAVALCLGGVTVAAAAKRPAVRPVAAAAAADGVRRPIVGDFDAELRKPNGHVDVAANIDALKALHANTYFYLIWHKPTDWDDLPAFAEAARGEGIDVWVYIVPWSETPLAKKSWGYSEPFRTDYVRWAQEIAKLSVEHPNIVGYVIDDFYTNTTQPDRFTVAYVRQMVEAGRRINPRIKFYPLVYFGQPWADFTQRFGTIVDGVVAAYPKSRVQVGNARNYLNDRPHGATAIVDFPKGRSSNAGDKGAIWADVRVTDPARAGVSFYWDEDNMSNERGFHLAYVRLNGEIVWQVDTAGGEGDRIVDLDLSRDVRAGQMVRMEIGIVEKRPVSRYPLSARFDDIRLTGFDVPEMASERIWSRKATGGFTVDLAAASKAPQGFNLPIILMPAGDPEQHEKRYPEPGTARNVANKVKLCVDLLNDGKVEGVVTYCLPKTDGDPVFEAVRQEYGRAAGGVADRSAR